MVNINNETAYTEKFAKHLAQLGPDEAVRQHVGDAKNFYRIGQIERRLLEKQGLQPGNYIIDLGCGGGRLAGALYDRINITYLGIDVVPAIIDYCRKRFPNYVFKVGNEFVISEGSEVAEFIVAFSLFTHLLHEETYSYIQDAYRVLKTNGKLLLSFLEYRNEGHRKVFMNSQTNRLANRPLIVFTDRECLSFFSASIGFKKTEFIDGSTPYVDFLNPEALPDGGLMNGQYPFGQSICIMSK